MDNILDMNIGLTIGLINEKNNQIIDLSIKNKNDNDEDKVVIGNAEMLKGM